MVTNEWITNNRTGVSARITYDSYGDTWSAEVNGVPGVNQMIAASYGLRNGHKSRAVKFARAYLRRTDW